MMTNKHPEHLVMANQPDSAAAEAFRILRTNISLRDFDRSIKLINVISATSGEAKTTTILNLAYSFSQLGKNVLLMDMDIRAPSLYKKLKVKNVGLSDWITGKVSHNDAIINYDKNFDVLLTGTKIPFASEFIQSDIFRKLLEVLKKRYDMIFIDCPPVNLVTDGMILSTMCDGTIMCIASGANEKRELEKTKDLLAQFNVNILGIVMTRMPLSKRYHNYDYGYYGSSEKRKKK